MYVSETLGDVELIASLLGPGPSPLTTAASLLEELGDVRGVYRAGPSYVATIKGMGPHRARRLHAAFTLGQRSLRPPRLVNQPITTPKQAAEYLAPHLKASPIEELHALYLDQRRRPCGVRSLTTGSDRFTIVDPRQVLRPAVTLRASGIILAHNHPSGDAEPSQQDRDVTRRLAQAASALGVSLLDHLIIAGEKVVSLSQLGDLPSQPLSCGDWTS